MDSRTFSDAAQFSATRCTSRPLTPWLLLLPCHPTLQKDALQTGVPLELSARLAAHTTEEAKRYSGNSCYESSDVAAVPLKLVSSVACGSKHTAPRTQRMAHELPDLCCAHNLAQQQTRAALT